MPSFTLTRHRAMAAAAIAIAAVFLAARVFAPNASPAAATVSVETPTTVLPATSPAVPPRRVLVVDVAGAVRRPGLYSLRQGSRIADAIRRAGGVAERAEPDLVNLAAPLSDGEQVLVPARAAAGAATAGVAAASAAPSPSSPVYLNSATAEQLDALPGVGPVTAAKIIAYREAHGPFTSVDQLDAIPGIGPSRIENLRGLVQP